MNVSNLFKPACPKCDGRNVKTINEGFIDNCKRSLMNLVFPLRIILGTGKKPKPLYVCKDDGFSWEKR